MSDNLQEALKRDPIVMAADAAKAACIRRIQRAIEATKRLGAMPLTAEECVTILEHMAWDEDLPTRPAPLRVSLLEEPAGREG